MVHVLFQNRLNFSPLSKSESQQKRTTSSVLLANAGTVFRFAKSCSCELLETLLAIIQ